MLMILLLRIPTRSRDIAISFSCTVLLEVSHTPRIEVC